MEKSSEKLQVATLLDPVTYAEFARKAEENERSIAAELRLAIKRHLDRESVEAAA